MNFYTVDRAGTLSEGLVCELVRHQDINPPELAAHVDSIFPAGVSVHGERYFLRNEAQSLVASPMLELFFEQVRCSSFSARPSRFQSMFAVESLEEARQFQAKFGGKGIFAVRADICFRGNMNLLNAGNSILVTSWLAHQYWASHSGAGVPCWEWLLQCPVSVGEQVA